MSKNTHWVCQNTKNSTHWVLFFQSYTTVSNTDLYLSYVFFESILVLVICFVIICNAYYKFQSMGFLLICLICVGTFAIFKKYLWTILYIGIGILHIYQKLFVTFLFYTEFDISLIKPVMPELGGPGGPPPPSNIWQIS